jgi:hypothetical protein
VIELVGDCDGVIDGVIEGVIDRSGGWPNTKNGCILGTLKLVDGVIDGVIEKEGDADGGAGTGG